MHYRIIRSLVPAAFLAVVFAPCTMRGQPLTGAVSSAAAHAANLDSALASAHAGNFSAAEATLFADNVQASNSLPWDVESATKLAHLAHTLRQTRDYPNSNTAAQRALARLADTSSRHSADTGALDRAQAYEMAGFIYETLLFDTTSAKTAYLQAQSLNPSSGAASAGLARVLAAEQRKNRVLGGHE